ncbi:MAG: HlyD family efflux transporter periplasmic adaptor subunit [Chloroflexi bacterium]|nr:HlyD family efflux transporter periplasmic adaptor subunit [Chloroflexota bacterium]
MRGWITVAVLAGLVSLAVVGAGQLFPREAGQPPAPLGTAPAPRTERVIRAEGRVVPERYGELAFVKPGRIVAVHIVEGDQVQAGQALVEIDSQTVQRDVRHAEAAQVVAEASLAQLLAPARAESVALAQAEVDTATARLDLLLAGARAIEIRQAEIAVNQAKNNLFLAHTTRDFAQQGTVSGRSTEMTEAQIGIAHEEINLAQAKLEELQLPPREEEVAQATAAVEAARQRLALARRPVQETEIQVARARVAQAEAVVAQVHGGLEDLVLRAPFAGTVVDVSARLGEVAPLGVAVVTMADLTDLRVDTKDLDENNIARVTPGQPVRMTVAGLDNRELRGTVREIARRATITASGDVDFTTRISLSERPEGLRWGMTVRLEFGD